MSTMPSSLQVPAVAKVEPPAVAPGWSKYAGVPIAHLSVDDLRDLRRQARGVSVRLVIERKPRPRQPRALA